MHEPKETGADRKLKMGCEVSWQRQRDVPAINRQTPVRGEKPKGKSNSLQYKQKETQRTCVLGGQSLRNVFNAVHTP